MVDQWDRWRRQGSYEWQLANNQEAGENMEEDDFEDTDDIVELSDEQSALLKARVRHIRRLMIVTPERYDLIMRALRQMVENCIVDDEFGYFCVQCNMYSEDKTDPKHDSECIIPQVEALLKELDAEPHPPSPEEPSPH